MKYLNWSLGLTAGKQAHSSNYCILILSLSMPELGLWNPLSLSAVLSLLALIFHTVFLLLHRLAGLTVPYPVPREMQRNRVLEGKRTRGSPGAPKQQEIPRSLCQIYFLLFIATSLKCTGSTPSLLFQFSLCLV